jgi:tetratricopeptide (TPR) repeat protein
MFRNITLICITIVLLSVGCERREAQQEATQQEATQQTAAHPKGGPAATSEPAAETPPAPMAKLLLQEPIELKRYESPAQALQQWYDLSVTLDKRPALLLYANNPLLQKTTSSIQRELLSLLANRDQEALRFDISDPAIAPHMTLNAALQAGFFSAVYWVLPASNEVTEFSIDIFRTQMIKIGTLSEVEARNLTLRDGVISGTISGVPFHALHPQNKFAISGPVAVHFDLGFLSPLYKGEIKTPIYPLIYKTLKHLRDQHLETVATSFSYSQITGEVPLGSRFVGDVFEQLFKQPKMLDVKLPAAWQQRANALYLPDLFKADDARYILLQQRDLHPDDPSLHYALYQVSRQIKSARRAALGHLAAAVQLDPVYALEYQHLVPVAIDKGRTEEALRMLQLAHEAKPDNPFFTLDLARALIAEGQDDSAVPLLQQLLSLNWSKSFYPLMTEQLQQLLVDSGH